jgi:thiamine biosynthesis lipoprotein
MILSRRRFLALSAALAASPASAQRHSWRGHAFGAEISITLTGSKEIASTALTNARRLIREIESTFSLYDPESELVQLNRTGNLRPSLMMREMVVLSDQMHRLTGGLFDPSIQPLWRALAQGKDDIKAELETIGWQRISHTPERITLAPAQALTFNGIAQGYATDRVTEQLKIAGFDRMLVNIGEYRALGGSWRLGLEDPVFGALGQRTLTSGAIATSSPMATPLQGQAQGHILHIKAQPQWSSVTVEAKTASLADALSTALVLAERPLIKYVLGQGFAQRVTMVDFEGNLSSFA